METQQLKENLKRINVFNNVLKTSQDIGEKYKLNKMAYPKILSIHINCGIGKYKTEKGHKSTIQKHLQNIFGQKPMESRAKKSVAAYKIHKGMVIAYMLSMTMGSVMGKIKCYSFLEKLIEVALPTVDEFSGFRDSVLCNGNLHLGIKDYSIFREVEYSDLKMGFSAIIKTNIKCNKIAKEFFQGINIPFKD